MSDGDDEEVPLFAYRRATDRMFHNRLIKIESRLGRLEYRVTLVLGAGIVIIGLITFLSPIMLDGIRAVLGLRP